MFAYLLHISSLSFAVVYFALGCAPCSDFFKVFVVALLAFFTVVFNKTFAVDFLHFSGSNIICYTSVLHPDGIYLLLVAI